MPPSLQHWQKQSFAGFRDLCKLNVGRDPSAKLKHIGTRALMSWDGHDNGAPLRTLARLPTDGVHVRRLARASLSGRNLKECLFCQAPKRLKKNRRLFESLCRCTWDFTPQRNAAYVRQDEAVLLEVKHTDLHARDVMYHMSCYKNYTCPRHLGLLSQRQVAMEDQNGDQSGQVRLTQPATLTTQLSSDWLSSWK